MGLALVSGLFAATIGGCGESGDQSGAPVVIARDSAGVRIVELSDVYVDSLPRWRVEGQPYLVVGEVAATPEYELFEVAHAILLGDGSVAVANKGTGEVRVFDHEGGHVRTFGRQGQGPGEFVGLSWLGQGEDGALMTFDTNLRRATWFTERGEVVRTLTVEPELEDPANATPSGFTSVEAIGLAQGRLLVRAGYFRRSGEGMYRDTFSIALVGEDGSLVETLAVYAGPETYFRRAPSGMTAAVRPIFGRGTHVAAFSGRMVVGSTDRFKLDVYDEAALTMQVVARVDLAPVTGTEVESWREYVRESAAAHPEEFGDLVRTTIEEVAFRETPPAFQQIVVDSGRSIWLAEPQRLPTGSGRWVVLAADGTPQARVDIPPDLKIFEVGEGYILGLRQDEQGVERVEGYVLDRGV